MPCIVSLPVLAAPCSNQRMGGIRAVYMRGAAASYIIAQGDQSIGDVYIAERGEAQTVRNWGLVLSDARSQYLEEMTVEQIVGAITGAGGVGTPFRLVATQRTGAVVESTIQVSDGGVAYQEHVLTLPVTGLTPEAANYVDQLMGADVTAIVVLWSGAWLGFGFDTPARLSGGGATTGASWGDSQGHTIQLTARSAGALPVDPVLLDGYGEEDRVHTPADVKRIIKESGIVVDPN